MHKNNTPISHNNCQTKLAHIKTNGKVKISNDSKNDRNDYNRMIIDTRISN
jgi:hypothetical protein